jgi:hypothetical protein
MSWFSHSPPSDDWEYRFAIVPCLLDIGQNNPKPGYRLVYANFRFGTFTYEKGTEIQHGYFTTLELAEEGRAHLRKEPT